MKELLIRVLKEGDNYGYDIVHQMREMTDGNLKWQEATIYPILKKLGKEEMIKSFWKIDAGERARKYYKLLEKGRKILYENREEWLVAEMIFEKIWRN